MGAMNKLKAYFGMMPADEVDDYDDYQEDGSYDRGPQAKAAGRTGYAAHDYTNDYDADAGYEPDVPRSDIPRIGSRRAWAAEAPTRGALAVDPQHEVMLREAPRPANEPAEQSLSRITTLHLRTYNEARRIGEPYRDGIPVIMDLTEMEDADAKRLVDFAAGLAFALRGSIEKITTKVFLISPPNVDVTAELKGRLAEGWVPGQR